MKCKQTVLNDVERGFKEKIWYFCVISGCQVFKTFSYVSKGDIFVIGGGTILGEKI